MQGVILNKKGFEVVVPYSEMIVKKIPKHKLRDFLYIT